MCIFVALLYIFATYIPDGTTNNELFLIQVKQRGDKILGPLAPTATSTSRGLERHPIPLSKHPHMLNAASSTSLPAVLPPLSYQDTYIYQQKFTINDQLALPLF
jgi:hypothetical protein